MEILLTPSNIMFFLGLFGIAFGIWNKIRNPQVSLEKEQAVSEIEVQGKAATIAQQLQWTIEATEKRFSDMQSSIKDSTTMAQNHIHSVDLKVDILQAAVVQMGKDLVQLQTIIEERIPRK